MPSTIDTVEKLIESKRFKDITNHRKYTQDEIELISDLINHIGLKNIFHHYKMFAVLVSHNLEDLITRWEWLKANKARTTLESFIVRFGDTIGPEKFKEYGEKQRISNSFEYKQAKFGWSKEDFDEYNKSRSVTLDLCIKRHGPIKGQEVWNHYVERQKYTNTLEYYKEKYNDQGYDKWLEYNQEKAKSSKVDWVMAKYDVSFNDAVEIIASRAHRSFNSLAEQTFVELFEQYLGYQLQYTCKTNQFCIWNFYSNSPCFYDVVDSARKKIIEFNGDYWHCNPLIYHEDFLVSHNGMTAREIWQKDYLKRKAALDRGFEVKVVWESDFTNNWQKVIGECVTWWNSN